jgi:hypothetical protein
MAIQTPVQIPDSPPPPSPSSNPMIADDWKTVATPIEPPAPPAGGMPPTVPWWKPRRSRKWWAFVGGGILAIVVAVVAGTTSSKPTTTATVQPVATGAPTVNASTVAPTVAATIAPTAAPTVAATAAPTAAPTAIPPPVAVTLSGHGDGVVKVPSSLGGNPMLLVATQNGSSNFIVEGLDANNTTTAILVNEIGSVSVTRPYNFQGSTGSVNFKITADGSWTLAFNDLSTARTFGSTISGKGDGVVEYTGGVGIGTFTNQGSSNFIVEEYSPSGSLLGIDVNEIGNWSGTGTISSGPVFLNVQSDGTWSIRAGS